MFGGLVESHATLQTRIRPFCLVTVYLEAKTVTVGSTVEFYDAGVDNMRKTGVVKCFQGENVVVHWPDGTDWESRTMPRVEVAWVKKDTGPLKRFQFMVRIVVPPPV